MRRTATYTVPHEGRDKNKAFIITEMSAAAAEDWAIRLFLGLARNGIEVPEDIASAGLAGIAALGVRLIGQMKYEDAAPLLSEMMDCVMIIPNPSAPNVTRALVSDDIEEVRTRLELRKAAIELHTGFSFADAASNSAAASAPKKSAGSQSTSTSRAQSRQ